MKICYVDDSAVDRILIPTLLTGGDQPWLRDVEIVAVREMPLTDILFAEYEGVILDERQGNLRGSDLARQVHHVNWRYPILIITGEPTAIPYDVLDYVDVVVSKRTLNEQRFDPLDPLRGTRAWIRWIARLCAASTGVE